jgi:uncharacterized SAM-binding protein YcdF (DUF218 family)
MRKTRVFLILAFCLVLGFLLFSGRFLVVNAPEKADLVVVVAGETERRPQRGLELLSQNYSSQMLLDVPAGTTIYQWTQIELAQKYVKNLPHADQIKVCPIEGLSTKEEALNVGKCLEAYHVHKILLVTSDFHTRRALSTFSRKLPNYQFAVAASYDSNEFGTHWWQHRQWAKTNLLEFSKLVWWELVERWS